MDRALRRRAILKARRSPPLPSRIQAEAEARTRIARKVRNQLRRMRPVTLVAPRWSAASSFMEELEADLGPSHICRVVNARGLASRAEMESWNFILHAINTLSADGADTRPVPVVVDRRGFLIAAEQGLKAASQETLPAALMIQSAEQLRLEVLEDLGTVWMGQEGRHTALLVAASVATPALGMTGGPWIELEDYTEAEAARYFVTRAGKIPSNALAEAVAFSGGIPSLVEEMAGKLATDGWPSHIEGWWKMLGPLAEDLRAAVQVALASPDLAERFFTLRDGRARAEEPRDQTLLLSGLIRRARTVGAARVQIRAACLAMLAEPVE